MTAPRRTTPGSSAYRAAVRLLPRAHRDQFGEDQVRLYEDLVASGTHPWRLWLALPYDLVVTAWAARGRRRLAPQPATGTLVAAPTTGWRRLLRALATRLAVLVHLGWLAGHLWAGVQYRLIVASLPDGVTGYDALPGHARARADSLLELWVFLVVTWILVPVTAAALPRKTWFAALWAVVWPLGMLLLWGSGSLLLD